MAKAEKAGAAKAAPKAGGKGPAAPKEAPAPPSRPKAAGKVPPRLFERFKKAVVPALMKERGYTNPFQVPRVEKIVINMGVGEGKENAKALDFATTDLIAITGQRPVITRAKKSIANFKLRAGVPIGAKVTLRGARMYEFLDRLVNVALPRVRDFRGVSPKAFDGRGNFALGLTEQVIFPEIRFKKAVVPALMKERGYTNPFQVPRVEKIVINMGVGEGKENAKALDFATTDLIAITGQRPVITRAKKSIANFKLREGVPIGAKVTLRGARMYEFLDRLVNVALPRVRDFRGVSPKAFDGRGNFALGLKEQVIFPEILYDKVDKMRGMDVIVVTSARTDEEAKALLTQLGMPFRE